MARLAFAVSLGQALAGGGYRTDAHRATPCAVGITAADDAVVAAQALEAAITSAQGAAEANGTIAGDGPALGLVQAIGTATAAYVAAIVTAKAATAAALEAASTHDVVLDIDDAVTHNGLDAALASIMNRAQGSGLS